MTQQQAEDAKAKLETAQGQLEKVEIVEKKAGKRPKTAGNTMKTDKK